jgi:hypothetical protein
MRLRILFAALLAICLAGCNSQNLLDQRAPEGHGLLPRPTIPLTPPRRALANYAFQALSPASDLSSRVLFETDEGPNSRVRVSEYSLPPHKGPSSARTEGATVLEMWTDQGTLKIGGHVQDWKQGGTLMVPDGAPVELTNPTDRELIIRIYTVEAK